MKLTSITPPRTFEVGRAEKIEIRHCANLQLDPDEQVAFTTESGAEYDVVRKNWGFFATPSLNSRLWNFGLRAVLVKSAIGRFYIFLVEHGKDPEFGRYTEVQGYTVVCWLDSDEHLLSLEQKVRT